ncbi:alpha/beta hydrolase [Streptomyces sp. NPDC059003]|uniref:alpha/beta hydrolase n=1 Tax=Streptomyces sp. NPDC059003 TaxID=3346691 RepID=UPI00369DFD69
MRLTPWLAAGLGLAGILAGAGPATAHKAAPPPGPRWGACPAEQKELVAAGAECAKVAVPLDYADPGGRTIRIAVSRVKAKDQAHRRGILLSNPGGPGGTGLANTLALKETLGKVGDQYDLIGFDPRFLGDSTPISCGPAGPQDPPRKKTSPRQDFEDGAARARRTADRCFAHGDNAALLPHASTRNVARDMDAIRAALGERKLSYYGVSYGADLGAVYTQLFPRRADRIVIDSSTDPDATQYELFQRAGKPQEAGLDEWAAWTARHADTYHLGRTAKEVRGNVQRLLKRAETRPIPLAGTRISAPLTRLFLRQFVQHAENDAALARTVRTLVDAAEGKDVEPNSELAALLGFLNSPDVEASMTGGAIFMCGDGGWPAGGWPEDSETYWKNMQRSRATQPVFGPLVNDMTAPCAFWKSTPREPGTRIVNNHVPVLMLQAVRDNNVPYDGALALHRKLKGSRLLSADIRSHGVYGRGAEGKTPVPCADDAVNAYLGGRKLPARDLTCPKPQSVKETR